MSFIINHVKKGLFLDSVMLMQISRSISKLAGVEEAALMMATPANQEILSDSNLLKLGAQEVVGGDLIVAIRAEDENSAVQAIEQSISSLSAPIASGVSQAIKPRTLRSALKINSEANLALISVPGDFACGEARKALRAGLNVMIFSDNIPLKDEIAIKKEASAKRLIVMGPDCGTALIGGIPLGFGNRVPTGAIGIIGASGTGIQEVSTLIANKGGGVSHAIGVGGRDLCDEVGGISTLTAIDWLESDQMTRHIVLISKPPSTAVAKKIITRLGDTHKPATVCFFGIHDFDMPANVVSVYTLRAVAASALISSEDIFGTFGLSKNMESAGKLIRGLFSGGSLAAEAQIILLNQGCRLQSNAPIQGVESIVDGSRTHTLLDLGADQYTRGRPHPMIDPEVRHEFLVQALGDEEIGVILIDVVIGFGANENPAAHVVRALHQRPNSNALVIASVTGTENDPQVLSHQVAILQSAGVLVAPSNAHATEAAWACVSA